MSVNIRISYNMYRDIDIAIYIYPYMYNEEACEHFLRSDLAIYAGSARGTEFIRAGGWLCGRILVSGLVYYADTREGDCQPAGDRMGVVFLSARLNMQLQLGKIFPLYPCRLTFVLYEELICKQSGRSASVVTLGNATPGLLQELVDTWQNGQH